MPSTATLGRDLKEVREEAGLSKVEMATILGVSRVQVSRIESGSRSTTLDTLQRWYAACGYRVEAVRIGTTDRAAELAAVLASADDDALAIAARLARLWPALDGRERLVIRGELDIRERVYLGGKVEN